MDSETRDFLSFLGARCEYYLAQADRCRTRGALDHADDWMVNASRASADAFDLAERVA